jgi:hypothetical protein
MTTVRLTEEEVRLAERLGQERWGAIRGRVRRRPLTEEMVAKRATEIDPERFVSFFSYGSDCDPYGFLGEAIERGELDPDDENLAVEVVSQIGRIWWVLNPDDDGFPVDACDFLEAHPEVSWDEIYAREEQWSRDLDPFHGIFR